VGELAQQLPISRPAVSQHLRVLKDGGLVVSRAEGTRRVYRLNPEGVTALRAYLDRIWEEALTAFQKAAEAAAVDPEQEDG
jgi:DNA-binding transcriptional ArsR family regulator